MLKKFVLATLLGLALLPLGAAAAQTPDQEARTLLEQDQFVVLDVGNYTPSGGAVDLTHAYAVIAFSPSAPTVASALKEVNPLTRANDALWAHAIAGYYALRKAYPDAKTMTVAVIVSYTSSTFSVETDSFDKFQLSGASQAAFQTIQLANAVTVDLITGATKNAAASSSTSPAGATSSPSGNATATTAPTRRPATATPRPPTATGDPCVDFTPKAAPDKALLWIRSQYANTTMRFTIGGGEWGTHDFNIPGDNNWRYLEMPPGAYTWSASIPGVGTGHGEKKNYDAGQCYSLDLRG